MSASLRGAGQPPLETEAARQFSSTDARPGTSISSSGNDIASENAQRNWDAGARNVASRRRPSSRMIKAAMRFLDPRESR
jgi:hypothetical protein